MHSRAKNLITKKDTDVRILFHILWRDIKNSFSTELVSSKKKKKEIKIIVNENQVFIHNIDVFYYRMFVNFAFAPDILNSNKCLNYTYSNTACMRLLMV